MSPIRIAASCAALLALLPTSLVAQDEPAEIAARGAGVAVRVDAVERLLLDRHGMSTQGREILDLLLKARLLDRLALEAGLDVTAQDVAVRWSELDRLSKAAGETGGLAAQIERQGLAVGEFRDFLRLSIIQERLTRRALELPPSSAIDASQQEVWLAAEIQERGLERPVAPWRDGIAARCGDVTIDVAEFATYLRSRLSREDVQTACWHLLLLAAIEKRMPDLSDEAYARGIDNEIGRRRSQHELSYPDISFEQRLGMTGKTIELLREDPAVQIAALSRIWVDRKYGADGLRATYEEERELFEGRFGRAALTHMLFLVAGRFKNELNPRTFEEAEAELVKFGDRIGDVGDFEALCSQFSEEPTSRQNQGRLGWLTRANADIPPKIRAAVFDFLDTGGTVPTGGRSIGPVRLDTGSALLWIAEDRPSPSWEVMSEHVHEELRRRFIVDLMPTGAMEVLLFEASAPKPQESPR